MLETMLPPQFDNTYRGHRLALWLFGLVVSLKLLMSVNTIFIGESVARGADAIPLDSYTPAGANTVVALFALWGLAHLMIVLVCALVLFRYRAMVPFMFALLLLEHLSRKLILVYLPIAKAGAGVTPGAIVNIVLLSSMIAGLALSLWRRAPAV